MKYNSVFEIIGPIMIGPSSSHTAGAARIGKVTRRIFGKPFLGAKIHFFGSFAETYRGHGTDVAIVGGLLSYEMDDDRIPVSLDIAKEQKIDIQFIQHTDDTPEHPNTVRIELWDEEKTMELTGISVGGGNMQITRINDFDVKITGEKPTLLVIHEDVYGTISDVARVFADYHINIGHMETSRLGKGDIALMQVETDYEVADDAIAEIMSLDNILEVQYVKG